MPAKVVKDDNIFEENEVFAAVGDASQDAVIVCDNEDRIKYWSRSAETMFGYLKDEVLDKELHDFIPFEKKHKTNKSNLERFGLTGKSLVLGKVFELKVVNKAGQPFSIELAVSSFEYEKKWYALGIIRNISAKKDLVKKYSLVFNNSPIGIVLVDKDAKISDLNPKLYELTGYKREDIVGQNALEMPFFTPDTKAIVAHNFAQRLKGIKVKPYEIEYIGEKGDTRRAMLYTSAIEDETGKLSQILVMFEDVTQKSKSDEGLKVKVKELEKMNQLMVDRELKMIELKEQLKSKKPE